MRLCLILSLIMLSMPFSGVQAADIFIKRKQPPASVSEEQRELDQLLGNEVPELQEQQKPIQTIEDFANQYYFNCLNQQHPTLQGEDKKMMCACTSANIPGNMTLPQVKEMEKNTNEGQLQRNRMMLFVYAPCIEYPTRSLISKQCLNNPQVKNIFKNYRAVCGCLSDRMGQYMKEHAPRAIENAMYRNQKDLDPLRVLLESETYEQQSQVFLNACITKHEFGQ